MISIDYVTAFRPQAPWGNIDLIENDLILTRALVELYQSKDLADKLAFRGGTALTKLFFPSPARFSEDLDFVQITAEPIGETLDVLRKILDPWLGEPKRKFGKGRATLIYRYETDQRKTKSRLKIEINTREHTSFAPLIKKPISILNPWFSGDAEVTTYNLEELLGTKLRALYQRKKGRDIFDLWYAELNCSVDWGVVAKAFKFYLDAEGTTIFQDVFRENIEEKLASRKFLSDIDLVKNPAIQFSKSDASDIAEKLIPLV